MKKSYISILLLLMVMILGISAASAADIDDTSDLAVTQDDSTILEVEDTSEEVQAASDTEVMADSGEGNNFTSLKTLINEADSSLTLTKDYTRVARDSDIEINKDFTIDGQDTYTIDANNLGGIFKVNTGYTLTLTGVTLINGNSDNGGAVYVENGATLNAEDCKFNQNTAVYRGGAIYTDGGEITLTNCVLDANDVTNLETSAAQNMGGAAIYAKNSQVTLVNTNVTNNGRSELDRSNGDLINAVINLINSDATITGGLFENNTGIYGGAIYAEGDGTQTLTVTGATFNNNKAYNGGAIDVDHGMITSISDSAFNNNLVVGPGSSGYYGAGGAIAVGGTGSFSLTDSNFTANQATGEGATGGAVHNSLEVKDASSISGCEFTDNTATDRGSAIFNNGYVSLSDNVIDDELGIYSNGEIDSQVFVIFMDNEAKTFDAYDDVNAYAKVVDDNGNIIKVDSITLVTTGFAQGFGGTLFAFNETDNLYHAKLVPTKTGIGASVSNPLKKQFATVTVLSQIMTVNPVDRILEVTYENISEGNPLTVNVKLTRAKDGALLSYTTVTIIIGNVTKSVSTRSGVGSVTFDNLTWGNYVINASVKGSSSYNPNEELNNLTVSPVKGTFTDLQYIIDNDEFGLVFLPYDFKYDPNYDSNLTNGVVINKNLYIIGNDYTIDANNSARIFNVTNGAIFKIDDATLTNGRADYGGAIYVDADSFLNTQNVVLYNNTATYRGGAIYSEGTVDVMDSVLDSNDITFRTANDDNGGAAIYNLKGALSISNSNMTNNLKDIVIRNGNAGDLLVGVVVTSGYTFIEDSYFANNTGSWGGAISSLGYMNDESYLLSVKNSKFEGNNATFGGAIFVESSKLEVDNCTFENNKGLGVGSSGTSNTQGGAIIVHPAQSSVSITDSTFTGNSANVGAAVSLSRVDGDSIIENCTFTDNTASSEGGAIYGYTVGKLTVANSTFSGNTAPWGNAISNDGILVLSNNTISGSSADIANYYGTIESEMNIVILNNETVTFSGEALIIAKVTDDNNNIIKDVNFVFVVNETELDAEFNSTSGLYQAIYKNDAAGLYVVNITYNEEENLVIKTGTLKNIKGTFTDLANIIANADPFTTTVLNGDYAYNEEFDSDLVNGIVIDKEIILDGNGSTISGNGLSRIFNITGGDIILHDTTLRDAVASYGGAVYVDADGEFTGYNVNFINNTAVYRGGAIYSEGLVQAYYSVFDSNDITFRTKNDDNGGAAIYNNNGFLAISDSNITNNLKDIVIRNGNAGDLLVGVVVTSGNTFIINSYFANNTGSWGGAISSLGYMNPEDYTVTIRDSKFEGNNATFGGAIYVESANLIVENSTFENNKGVGVGSSGTSNTQGGAIVVHPSGSSATITDSTFIANSANVGGAVSLPGVDEDSVIDNCTFIDNTASADGGALYFWTEGAGVTVKDSEFVNNTAPYGGAIENEGIGDLTVDNCIFTENTASARGGAIISSGNTDVSNSVFTDNEALGGTNAIYLYNEGTTLELSNNTITGDTVQILVKSGIDIVNPLNATFLGNQTVPAYVGDIFILNATLTDDKGNFIYDADFKFSVDGETIDEVLFDDETGLYTVGYYIGTAGPKVISTNYELDRLVKYTGILDVPKANITEFGVLTIDALEGENATIWITLIGVNDQGLNSTVTVIVNNKEYAVPVENGEGNLTVEGLTHGQYPVVAMFDDPSYNPAINSSVFFVKGQAKLNITELTVAEYGDVIEIAINLTGSDGKPLTGVVVVDDVINVLVENGIGTFVIDNQPDVGNLTFQAVYDGDNDYFGDLAVFNVTVNTKVIDPEDIVVDIPNINEFGEAIPITITSPVDGTYTVNINGTPVEVEVVNGVGNATITLDKPGIYNATVDIAEEGYSLETITTDEFEYLVTPEFNVEITGTYPEAEISITGPAGTYHIIIDGMEPVNITREESDLPTTKKITGIDAGNYTAYVSFDARNEYYGDYKEINFTVNKAALEIAEPEVIGDKVVDAKLNITFTLPTDVDPSSVSAFMDGSPIPEFVINETTGVYTLPLDGFSAAGGHLFTVQVNDPNYEEAGAQVTFTIEKAETTVTIEVDGGLGVMGGATVNVTVSKKADGNISIDNNGVVSVVEITNGTYSFEIYDLQAGEYYINVTFLGNDKYLKSNATKVLNIPKSAATPKITDVTAEITLGEYGSILVEMDQDFATGNITVFVDGVENQTVVLEEDYPAAIVLIPGLTIGDHTIGVRYNGDDNYDVSGIVNTTINVVQAESKVTIDPIDNVIYGEDVYITYTVENQTDVVITVHDNTGEISPEMETVDGIIVIKGLKPGDYQIMIENAESDEYKYSYEMGYFTVGKAASSVTIVEIEDLVYPGNGEVLYEIENKTDEQLIILTFNGAEIEVLYDDEIVQLTDLAAGEYTLTIVNIEDDLYNESEASISFKVLKADPTFTSEVDADAKVGENVTITVKAPADATGNVSVSVDGEIVATDVPVVNGTAIINVTGLVAGHHSYDVSYAGDDNYNSATDINSFDVAKAETTVTIEVNGALGVMGSATVNVTVSDNVSGYLSIDNDGTVSVVEITNGTYSFEIYDLQAGDYYINATFLGNDNYLKSNATKQFEIPKSAATPDVVYTPEIKGGEKAELNVNMDNNLATGVLRIYVDGEEVGFAVLDENYANATVFINDLANGTHTIGVKYAGNDNFNESDIVNVTVTVVKADSKVTINPITNVTVGNDVVIYYKVENYTSIKLEFTNPNDEITVDYELFEDRIVVHNLAAGDYEVKVYNMENEFYNTDADVALFTVNKIDVSDKISIEPETITYGENATVIVNGFPEAATGNVTIKVGNKNYTAKVEGGQAIIEISGLAAGTYEDLAVEYSGDDVYNATNANCAIYVNKASSKVTIFVIADQPYPGDIEIEFLIDNETERTITINGPTGDEVPYVIGADDKIVLTDLVAGDYYVTIENKENENFTGSEAEDVFKVYKADPTFTSNVTEDAKVGENVTITVKAPADATGNVTVIVDGEIVATDLPVINGVATINVTYYLAAGHHSYEVTYNGDDNYEIASDMNSFDVVKVTPEITISDIAATVGTTVEATVTIAGGDATGYILYNNVAYKLENAQTIIQVGISEAGMQSIAVTYLGDDKYANGTGVKEFDAAKAPTTISLADSAITVLIGNDVEVKYTIDPSVSEGNVTVWINDEVYYNEEITQSTGSVIIAAEDLPTDDIYTVKVQYVGTTNYKDSNVETLLIDVADEVVKFDIYVPENTTTPVFNITVPTDATGLLLVDIDGKHYYAEVENGIASITVPGLEPGNYTANVTYTGDDLYLSVNETFNVTVPANADEDSITIPEGASALDPTFSINLPSDATGYFEVDVDGKKYVVPVENGTASITVPGLSAGDHNVTVKYSGDSKYNSISKSTTLNLKEPVAKLSENKYIKVVYSGKATYKVRLTLDGKPAAGKTVTINFNGKNYNVVTDSKGYATLKLDTKVKPKKYTVTATYKDVKVTSKVKVKHVIKAKNKKAKKSKKLKLKVKLKKVDGKVLKNKKVKLKFKGKKYTAKTNKKGKAKFTIKKKVMKKLKKGKKYKYKVYYGKDKVSCI